MIDPRIHQVLNSGLAIPAHPLALTNERKLDERRQRALSRYYIDAGAGGLAVAAHTTQFAIREAQFGLFQPVLALAAEEMDQADRSRETPLVRVGGICGDTRQAVAEAETLRELNYHAGLLNLGAAAADDVPGLIAHCRAVGRVIPIFGFYLSPSVGGRVLPYTFWRQFCQIENVVAIKVAAFNRYQTLDVVRAVAESGRADIALYTGNDDNIVADLLTPFQFQVGGQTVERRFVGGLLGHWAFWTQSATQLLVACQRVAQHGQISAELLRANVAVTDVNAAVFDPAHNFRGCIPGVLEILRRQGLLENNLCLDPQETLSPGQAAELDRVAATYPEFADDQFIAEHRDQWLSG